MSPEQWQKIKGVFQAAVNMPPADRESYISQACINDDEMLTIIEELLEAHQAPDDLVADGARNFSILADEELQIEDSYIGSTIGMYSIEEHIGEGGMGVVYLANRADGSFDRKVAIKLIRGGMNSENILERFRRERQTLAILDHPYITRLHDGGQSPDGLPYFVMEFVDGLPLKEYCDRNKLSITERLELFLKICSAVSYAHQNLVIHRDLKPANILVNTSGEPKLLDFGISKLLRPPELELDARLTVDNSLFLTPEYASPEQVQGLPISTTTDVYALGAILYTLLAGIRAHSFTTRSAREIERIVCEVSIVKPGAAIEEMRQKAPDSEELSNQLDYICHSRNAAADQLGRTLRGDLDNIILLAMRKDPKRRYASVQQLAEDIERYLQDRPVNAHKESFTYLAGKLLRRNKAVVLTGLLIFLILVGGIISTTWQANIAAAERDRVQIEAEKAQTINQFLQDMLASANPRWYGHGDVRGQDVTVLQVMKEASEKIDSTLAEHPEIRAELHLTLGDSYLAIGEGRLALSHFEAAYDIRKEIFDDDAHETIEALYYLTLVQAGEGELAAAINSIEEALRQLQLPQNQGDVYLPHALTLRATLAAKAESNLDEALDYLEQAQQASIDYYGYFSLATGTIMGSSSLYLCRLNRLAEADSMLALQTEIIHRLSEPREYDLTGFHIYVKFQHGVLASRRGELEKAERFFRGALQLNHTLSVPNKSRSASLRSELGRLLNISNRPDSAVVHLSKALKLLTLGDSAGDSAFVPAVIRAELAYALHATGQIDEAHRLARNSLNRLMEVPRELPEYTRARQMVRAVLEEK